MASFEPIPQEWIKEYIDQLIKGAKEIPEGPFRTAILNRVAHAMDLVEAFRNRNK